MLILIGVLQLKPFTGKTKYAHLVPTHVHADEYNSLVNLWHLHLWWPACKEVKQGILQSHSLGFFEH